MTAAHARDLVDYAPLLAILVAVGVGLMQYYVQHQQAKQQLFEKRFEVYLALRRFLSGALEKMGQPLDYGAYREFREAMRPVKFLFGQEVSAYIHGIEKDIAREEDASGRTILRVGWEADEFLEIHIKWGRDAERVFLPYLRIHRDGWWISRLVHRVNRWMDEEQPALMATRYPDK